MGSIEDIYSENQVLKLKHERALNDQTNTHERERKTFERVIKDLQKEIKGLKGNGSPNKVGNISPLITSMEKVRKRIVKQESPMQETPELLRPQSSANILYTARTSMSGAL